MMQVNVENKNKPNFKELPPKAGRGDDGPMQESLSGGGTFDIDAYRKEKRDKVTQMTDSALQRLGEDLSAGHSDSLTRYLKTMSRFHRYSLSNQLLIYLQSPEATHVAGYERWKQLGRQVKRGEKGILILAPITRVIGTTTDTDSTGTASERPVRKIVNAKGVFVFDVSQTDGKPLPDFASVRGNPGDHLKQLERIYEEQGVSLNWVPKLQGGAKGVSEGGKVRVLKGLEPGEAFSVAVHELAHEMLHRGERRQSTTTKVRETEAEAVAFVVCSAIGLDNSTAARDYIHLYRGTQETLEESLRFVRGVSIQILDRLLPKPDVVGMSTRASEAE